MTQTSSFFEKDGALSPQTLDALWQQALHILQALQTPEGIMASGQDDHFHAIFGRDSLWSVLLALGAGQMLREAETQAGEQMVPALRRSAMYDVWLHELSATVLRGLVALQGRVVNDYNEEQPGRIVHEYWHPVPPRMVAGRWPLVEGRYYGTFDATFLYIITVARVHAYFRDLSLLQELWPSVEAAARWMLDWSDLDQDGLVEYQRRNPEGYGLDNQVWKDSSQSIQPRKGEQLQHPLAWIELQGYAWAAYASYLELAAEQGNLEAAAREEIARRMSGLQQGIERFWLADERTFAIALDGHKQPIQVVSSNPGHLLWSGILARERAAEVSQRLLQPDLLTPWGLRTLSDRAYYYNPFQYQCGTVWPFDNAIAVLGLRQYGYHAEGRRLALGILEAIQAIGNPVELYMVLSPSYVRLPKLDHQWMLVDYFEACAVQAWTAAGILYLTSLLRFSSPGE